MKAKLQKLLSTKMTRRGFIKGSFILFISSFAIYGVIEQLLSHAATPFGSEEADKGSRTGDTTVIDNASSIDGKAVEFGAVASTGTGGSNTGTSSTGSMVPSGPTGSYKLAWNDEFDDSEGMSGVTNGLNLKKWNGGYGIGPTTIGGPGQNIVTQSVQEHGAGQEGNGNFQGPGAISLKSDGIHLDCISSNIPDSYGISPYNENECGAISTAGIVAFNPANVSYNSVIQDAINAGTVTSINGDFVVEYYGKYPGPGYTSPGSGVLNNPNIPLWWPAVWFTNMDYNPSSVSSNWPGGGASNSWTEEVDVWESYACGIYGTGLIGQHINYGVPKYNDNDTKNSIPSQFANTDMGLDFHTYTFEISNNGNTITAWVDGVLAFTDSSFVQSGGNFATPQYLGWTMQTHYPGNEGSTGTLPAGPAVSTNQGIYHGWTIRYVRIFQPA